MMRILHDVLREVINPNYDPYEDDDERCYFNPPDNIQMSYPCIVYDHVNDLDEHADNIPYTSFKRYSITIMDQNPDSKIPTKLKETLSYCELDRKYTYNGLNHFVYTLYFNGPRIKEDDENE